MKHDQAEHITSRLKGLMPRMTDEQVDLINDSILPLDHPEKVEQRLVAYASSCPASAFDVSSCLAAAGISPGVAEAERTRQRYISSLRISREIDSQWSAVDQRIADISDEELVRMRDEVLMIIGHPIAAKKRNADARTDKTVKALIANHFLGMSGI